MENISFRNASSIMGIQYFLYFGSLGIFLPYFNLYCYHIGLSGFQIGFLSGIRSVAFALFPLFWGGIADRIRGRRPIYIVCHFMSMCLWGLYFFTSQFWPMLIITFFYGIFYSPIISFLEAATMDTLARQKSRYGHIRVWGSISFILAVIGFGELTDYVSTIPVIHAILIVSLLQCVFSFGLPKTAAPHPFPDKKPAKPLLTRGVVIFLLCGFLMLVSHSTYYGFFSIHLESLGWQKSHIGMAWAVGVIAEIVVMTNSKKIFRRFSIETVLRISFVVATVRWVILAFFQSPLIIFSSQILHAVTYGSFHMASILYMDKLSPKEAKTTGQAVNNAITYGFGLMIGFFLSGAMYESIGAGMLFLASAGVALLGGILFFAIPKK